MTFPRYRALTKYWLGIPPADITLAAVHGLGQFEQQSARRAVGRPQLRTVDGKPAPPTMDEKPGTMKDIAALLKASGRRTLAF